MILFALVTMPTPEIPRRPRILLIAVSRDAGAPLAYRCSSPGTTRCAAPQQILAEKMRLDVMDCTNINYVRFSAIGLHLRALHRSKIQGQRCVLLLTVVALGPQHGARQRPSARLRIASSSMQPEAYLACVRASPRLWFPHQRRAVIPASPSSTPFNVARWVQALLHDLGVGAVVLKHVGAGPGGVLGGASTTPAQKGIHGCEAKRLGPSAAGTPTTPHFLLAVPSPRF